MGRIWMPGGGGGADLDVITAGAGDVLSGKVIVDQDGNPITGTIPVKNAIASSINCGGSVDIPAGYYPTAGKTHLHRSESVHRCCAAWNELFAPHNTMPHPPRYARSDH